eukprot:SM000255S08767  [mRNA]  locus=s255:56491:57735:+ [translate_table: standard]
MAAAGAAPLPLLLPACRTKAEVDEAIRGAVDKVVVLRFGRASDPTTMHLDDINLYCTPTAELSTKPIVGGLATSCAPPYNLLRCTGKQLGKVVREVSRFATLASVDVDAPGVQVYIKYFDITLTPATIFFFNAHHMKMDSGTADHTKWIGSFHNKQDFIDVVETIFRAAMKGKLIVTCPLPPERVPRYQLLYKDY